MRGQKAFVGASTIASMLVTKETKHLSGDTALNKKEVPLIQLITVKADAHDDELELKDMQIPFPFPAPYGIRQKEVIDTFEPNIVVFLNGGAQMR